MASVMTKTRCPRCFGTVSGVGDELELLADHYRKGCPAPDPDRAHRYESNGSGRCALCGRGGNAGVHRDA